MKKYLNLLLLFIFTITLVSAQEQKEESTPPKQDNEKSEQALLNSRGDDGVKRMDMGLPQQTADGFGRTLLMEDGLPVLMEYPSMSPLQFTQMGLNIAGADIYRDGEALVMGGNVGFVIDVKNRKPTRKFTGRARVSVTDYGRYQGMVLLSDQIGKGWGYSFDATGTMDKLQYEIPFTDNYQKDLMGRLVLEKKWKKSNLRLTLRHKTGTNYATGNPKSVFMYGSDEKASQYKDVELGKDVLIPSDPNYKIYDVLSGEEKTINLADGAENNATMIDLGYDLNLENNWKLSTDVRYSYIETVLNAFQNYEYPKTQDEFKNDFAANDPNLHPSLIGLSYASDGRDLADDAYLASAVLYNLDPYTLSQHMVNVKLAKKNKKHDFVAGLSSFTQSVSDRKGGQSIVVTDIAKNMERVDIFIDHPQYGRVRDLTDNGILRANARMVYISGSKTRSALYANERYSVNDKLKLIGGIRLERVAYNVDRMMDRKTITNSAGNEVTVLDNKFNTKDNFTDLYANLGVTYKFSNRFDVFASAARGVERLKLNELNDEDESIKLGDKTEIQMATIGANFGGKNWAISSSVNYIRQNGLYERIVTAGLDRTDRDKYDIQTIGWRNQFMIKPFKGFTFNAVATIQNPQRKGLRFVDEELGIDVDYDGTMPAGISEVILDINPTYTFNKNKTSVWGTLRYFSKTTVTNSNDFYLAPTTELFGGIKHKINKKLSMELTGTNLLNTVLTTSELVGRYNAEKGVDELYGRPQMSSLMLARTFKLTVNYKF